MLQTCIVYVKGHMFLSKRQDYDTDKVHTALVKNILNGKKMHIYRSAYEQFECRS